MDKLGERLVGVHGALSQVEVRGRANLSLLLGALSAIEEILSALSQDSKEEKADGIHAD